MYSINKDPTLELKHFTEHLKYVYLGEGDIWPIIVTSKLMIIQEEKLIRLLRDYEMMTREPQRKLNLPMMENG